MNREKKIQELGEWTARGLHSMHGWTERAERYTNPGEVEFDFFEGADPSLFPSLPPGLYWCDSCGERNGDPDHARCLCGGRFDSFLGKRDNETIDAVQQATAQSMRAILDGPTFGGRLKTALDAAGIDWSDSSYHNDMNPSIHVEQDPDGEKRIAFAQIFHADWAPDHESGDWEYGSRYVCARYLTGEDDWDSLDWDESFETDDPDAVIAWIASGKDGAK